MKIPTKEKLMVSYMFDGVKRYITTKHLVTNKFALYKITDNGYKKLKTANTPLEFNQIVEEDRRKNG